eukprot:52829-Hanusia_phi.AAC.3
MFEIFGKNQQFTMLMCSNLQECLDHRMVSFPFVSPLLSSLALTLVTCQRRLVSWKASPFPRECFCRWKEALTRLQHGRAEQCAEAL